MLQIKSFKGLSKTIYHVTECVSSYIGVNALLIFGCEKYFLKQRKFDNYRVHEVSEKDVNL
jgi:hypothetical protein